MNFDRLFSNNCYVIAEAGLNHNGSIKIAKKLIDLAAEAGANAVKFQKRTVEQLATKSTLDKIDNRFPDFGNTYRQIREHLEFNNEQYLLLKKYSEDLNLDFIVTAFDNAAVDFLEKINIKIYKLASHSLTNYPLLEYISKKNKPVILSTGMCNLEEIDQSVEIFKRNKTPLALMHCVSSYPTPLDECNLSMMEVLRKRYNLPVGYSGHELGYLPTLASVSLGANLVERHYTLDKKMIGFDHKMSLDPNELISMIRDIRSIHKIVGNGKKEISETEWITRKKYHVSMVSSKKILKNSILDESMVVYRNPGTGISYKKSQMVLGKKAKKDIDANVLLSQDMFIS